MTKERIQRVKKQLKKTEATEAQAKEKR